MTAVYTMCVGESYVSEGKIIFFYLFLIFILFLSRMAAAEEVRSSGTIRALAPRLRERPRG
jgi:hypothetical protein